MSLRDSLLPRIDKIRDIPGRLGLRLFRVFVRTTDAALTSGQNADFGEGTVTHTETELLTSGGYPPHVKSLSTQEVVASAGLYVDEDLRVGPLTPDYTVGGISVADLDPSVTPNRVLAIRVTGPGYPIAGALFRVQAREFNAPFHYSLVIRKSGV